jgi:hypothetical protein
MSNQGNKSGARSFVGDLLHVGSSIRLGKPLVQRQNDAVVRILDPDRKDVTELSRNAYTFGSSDVKGTRYLLTRGLDKGVAILAWNEKKKVGMLAHVGSPLQAIQALQKVQVLLEADKVTIYGGRNSSNEILSAIAWHLKEGQDPTYSHIKVVSQNTKRGSRYEFPHYIGSSRLEGRYELPRSIGLDTETGRLFTLRRSKQIGVYKHVPLAAPDLALEYYSKGQPQSRFMGIMQDASRRETLRWLVRL